MHVGDLQLDSYSETAASPVLLHVSKPVVTKEEWKRIREREREREREKDKERDGKDGETMDAPPPPAAAAAADVDDGPPPVEPAFKCSMIQEQDPVSGTPHFKYIAVRLLELVVAVDYATLQLLVLDLGADFSYVSRSQQLALRSPERWADEFSMSLFAPERRLETIDVYKTQSEARAPKVFIENLVLHPIKVSEPFSNSFLALFAPVFGSFRVSIWPLSHRALSPAPCHHGSLCPGHAVLLADDVAAQDRRHRRRHVRLRALVHPHIREHGQGTAYLAPYIGPYIAPNV